jgi:cell wall-associated NlpC family hydrolase
MIPAEQVIAEARSWVGVPFKHQGRDRRGIDCVGLPIVICSDLGVLREDFVSGAYSRLPAGALVTRLQEECVQVATLATACLVVIAWTRVAAHVAIYTGTSLVHAYESVGTVVEHGYRGRWVRMSHSFWRLPGVQYE